MAYNSNSMVARTPHSNDSRGRILIFLDMDGVMLPFPFAEKSTCGASFPDENLAALSQILEAFPSAEIVLSSTWRVDTNAVDEIIDSFQKYGNAFGGPLKGFKDFGGMTDPGIMSVRQAEIANYLDVAPGKVAAWVALDDEELVEGFDNQRFRSRFMNNAVRTNPRAGLTRQDAKAAIQLLNNQLGKTELDSSGRLPRRQDAPLDESELIPSASTPAAESISTN